MMEIPFEHLSAAHCENGVTGNLLRFYGYDYSEPLIFGLSASLYFVHLPFVHLAGFPVTSFRPLPGAIFARATRLLGFKVRRTIFLCPKHAEKKLDRLLVQGIPTGAVVGMYFLPYVPNEYRFHFNAHNICVIGKDGDDYLVSDPVAVEKVKLSAHDMMRARFSKGTYPPMGKLYWIRSLPKKQPDLPKLIRKAILKNCYRMLHEPGPVPWVGINAFRHLGNKIPKFPGGITSGAACANDGRDRDGWCRIPLPLCRVPSGGGRNYGHHRTQRFFRTPYRYRRRVAYVCGRGRTCLQASFGG